MTQLKTQCPICDALFVLPEKALDNPLAKARCKHCQSIFLVNEHIYQADSDPSIDTAPVAFSEPTGTSEQTTSSENQAAASSPSVRPIFSKDSHNQVDDYGLGDIDWRSDALPTTRHPESSYSESNRAKHAVNKDAYDAANADADAAWLNDLLDEELPVVSDPDTMSVTDTSSARDDLEAGDLTELLSEFGVESVTPATVTREEVLAKMNARLENDRASERNIPGPSPMAKLFWLIGCLALALLLFAQYVIFNVDDLVKDPANASKLTKVCELANCSLPGANLQVLTLSHIKHRPSQVNAQATHSDIMAAIVNQSDVEQLYPNLHVSVYGEQGLVGEFVAGPEDYLTPPQRMIIGQQAKLIMFTVPVKDAKIDRIDIRTFY